MVISLQYLLTVRAAMVQRGTHILDIVRLGGQRRVMALHDNEFTSRTADDCRTMTDVRQGVDQVDKELIALLKRRFAYMRAAARIKDERGAVRDEHRKAAVIRNAAILAIEAQIPPSAVEEIWEVLVENSIAYELAEWDRIRQP